MWEGRLGSVGRTVNTRFCSACCVLSHGFAPEKKLAANLEPPLMTLYLYNAGEDGVKRGCRTANKTLAARAGSRSRGNAAASATT